MITRIEVDGFKTLSNFTLDFKPGLNILIGPNGAGKTNLVSFFEFLSQLVDAEASEAVSRVGGAGAVFRRLADDNYQDRIRARIYGCVRDSMSQQKKDEKSKFIRYEYGFELIFPASRDAVLFSNQSIKASASSDFVLPSAADYRSRAWHFELSASVADDGTATAKVQKLDQRFVEIPMPAAKNNKDEAIKQVELFVANTISKNLSLVSSVPRFSYTLYVVSNDLSAGRVYNIVPSRIKVPEDSAKPPGIDRDGSGLSATLYAIRRSKDAEEYSHWAYYIRPHQRQFSPAMQAQLRSYLQVVNSSIENFDVTNDPFDNQLRVRFQIRSGDYRANVPLTLMSDGTLKWIALMTAALAPQSVFSIEEPENYLHPHMQGQLVNILREILFKDDEYRMTIMTTHSETLLNQCRPDELVILCLEEGRTTAIRCKNTEEVSQEIRRTGFGLGYYYVSNALQDM